MMTIAMQDSFTDVHGTNISLHTPEIGGSWSYGIVGGGASCINTNQFAYVSSGNDMGAAKGAIAPGADCYLQFDISAVPTTKSLGGGIRGSGSYGSFTGYCLIITPSAIYVGAHSNGNRYGDYGLPSTKIITVARSPIVATYRLEVVGNDFTLKENGTVIGTASDATYPSAGFVSIYAYGADTGRMDNLEAGDYVPPVSAGIEGIWGRGISSGLIA